MKRVEINASFGNKIFWRSLVSKTKHTSLLSNDLKSSDFGNTIYFWNKALLPFCLNQTKLVLKMISNHFSFWKVKHSQSNLVFRKPHFDNNTFETRFLKTHFGFANLFYGKVYFWKGFGFQGKIKVFKTNLSQKIFGLKTLCWLKSKTFVFWKWICNTFWKRTGFQTVL